MRFLKAINSKIQRKKLEERKKDKEKPFRH